MEVPDLPLSVDCHIAISPLTPGDWVVACLESLYTAVAQAPYPVHLHFVQAVPHHIGLARHDGYRRGEAPYVCHIDDDDYVTADAFTALYGALLQRPDAVFPRELILQNGTYTQGAQQHQLMVFKRDYLIDFSVWPSYGDVVQMRRLQSLRFINIPQTLYVYRVYLSHAKLLGRTRREELERARDKSFIESE